MAKTRWLTRQEQHAWRAFLQTHARVERRLRRSLQRDAGLSDADYPILVALSEAPDGRLRSYELVEALQWEKSRLSHQLRRMEQRGLVERAECETDARGAFVLLTPAGRATIEAAAPEHVAEVRRSFLDALTPAQVDALAEIGETVLAHLAELDREAGSARPDR